MSRAEDDAIAAEMAALPVPTPAPRPARKPNPTAIRQTAATLTALADSTALLSRVLDEWVKIQPNMKRQIRDQAATNRALLRTK